MMFKTFRRRSLAWLGLGAFTLGASAAHADPSAAELGAAKQAFENAARLESEQRFQAAEIELRKALAVKETPGLHFHLAHCAAEQGHLVEAASEYERVSELFKRGANAPDVKRLLGPASAALDRRIPRLVLEFPEGLRDPAVTIDGKPYPPSDLAVGLPLNPGAHQLKAGARDRLPFVRQFQLAEGERLTLRAVFASEPPALASAPAPVLRTVQAVRPRQPAASPPVEPARASPGPKPYLMVGEGALTVAALAVGIGYRVAVSSDDTRISKAQARVDGAAGPDLGSPCQAPMTGELVVACSDLGKAIDDQGRHTRLSNVGFVAAGVGAAALLTTWIFYPSAKRETAEFRWQPTFGLGQLGLRGDF